MARDTAGWDMWSWSAAFRMPPVWTTAIRISSSRSFRRRLKLRELDILMAVVQTGGMRKAADQLHMSQPAVSRAIADLERTLGVTLLDRGPQGVEPTVY